MPHVIGSLSPEDLTELIESAAAVASQSDLRDVLQTTVERGMQLTGARYGALGVVGHDGTLVEFHHAGLDDDTVANIGRYPEGVGILGLITSEGKPVRLDHISDHPAASGFPEHHPHMQTLLGVPIRVGNRIFGNLYLTEKQGGFTDADQALTEALAVIAASAVQNARASEHQLRAALISDRARIARDLHDAIIQELYAVGLSLQGLAGAVHAEAKERLEAAVDLLDESIAALRRFIFDLRPPVWAQRQFGREMKDLVNEMSLSYGFGIDLTLSGSHDGVSETTTETASLVVREVLSNALRHAMASRIDVVVREDAEGVNIAVVDNGVGFDPSSVDRGMGLDNIHQLVRQRGGEVEIASAPGSGTKVKIRLPL